MTVRFTLTCGVLMVMCAETFAQTPTVLIREDDMVTPAGHMITFLNNTEVNCAGGYAISMSTSDGTTTLSQVWGNATGGPGAFLQTEALGVAGYDQTSFESTFGMDDLGAICYSPSTTEIATMTTGLDAVWVGSTPLAVEDDPIMTLPGKVFRFNSRPKHTCNSIPYWIGGINDGTSGANEGNGLFMGAGQTVLVATGDPAPAPLVSTIGNAAADFDARMSALGTHWINQFDTIEPSTANSYMQIDGAVAMTSSMTIIGEGQAIPVASGGSPAGENWDSFDRMGINENGDWFVTGDTDGDAATDEFIAFNGDILYREGDTIDGITVAGGLLNSSGYMNEDTDIGYMWGAGGLEFLFLNDQVVLSEGDMVDWDGDGTVEPTSILTDFTGSDTLTVSNRVGNLVRLYFTADVDVAGTVLEGFFCMEVDVTGGDDFPSSCNGDGGDGMGCTPCPCGNDALVGTVGGCINSSGVGARLIGSGSASVTAVDPTDLRFDMEGGVGNSFAVLTSGDAIAPQNPMSPCFGLPAGVQSAVLDGLRCAVTNTQRHGGRPVAADGTVGSTTNGWGGADGPAVGLAAQGGFVAGQTRHYQTFYRELPGMVCGTEQNTTQAVSVTFEP